MLEKLKKLFTAEKCPHCGKGLTELRVKLKPGAVESGPYYRCDKCGHRYLTEDGQLVQAGPSPSAEPEGEPSTEPKP